MISFNFHLSYPVGWWKPTLFLDLWVPCNVRTSRHPEFQTTPLFCLIYQLFFAPSLPLSGTLERQTQSPSVYGTTRRSTKSRAPVSWAVSVSCPTPSTDSKTLAVSTCLCVHECILLWFWTNTHWKQAARVWSVHAYRMNKHDIWVSHFNLSSHSYVHTSCTQTPQTDKFVDQTETSYQGAIAVPRLLSACSGLIAN